MKNAVLFIIFNRPHTTHVVFEKIKNAKPPRLYIAADGPRKDNKSDIENCKLTREIIQEINWECQIKTLFRDENLGCKYGVFEAITWFFEYEEQGIILEDDVVPSMDFFYFCDRMLYKYKNENDVFIISGFNPLGENIESNDYYFSRDPAVWGWATWRRVWQLYDVEILDWKLHPCIERIKLNIPNFVKQHYSYCFDLVTNENLDTWDYQLLYCLLVNNAKAIKPKANLISNIGTIGTHSRNKGHNHFLAYGKLDKNNINDPINRQFDEYEDLKFYKSRYKYLKFRRFIRKILVKIGLISYIVKK